MRHLRLIRRCVARGYVLCIRQALQYVEFKARIHDLLGRIGISIGIQDLPVQELHILVIRRRGSRTGNRLDAVHINHVIIPYMDARRSEMTGVNIVFIRLVVYVDTSRTVQMRSPSGIEVNHLIDLGAINIRIWL